jgi:hypothetical protein
MASDGWESTLARFQAFGASVWLTATVGSNPTATAGQGRSPRTAVTGRALSSLILGWRSDGASR